MTTQNENGFAYQAQLWSRDSKDRSPVLADLKALKAWCASQTVTKGESYLVRVTKYGELHQIKEVVASKDYAPSKITLIGKDADGFAHYEGLTRI